MPSDDRVIIMVNLLNKIQKWEHVENRSIYSTYIHQQMFTCYICRYLGIYIKAKAEKYQNDKLFRVC